MIYRDNSLRGINPGLRHDLGIVLHPLPHGTERLSGAPYCPLQERLSHVVEIYNAFEKDFFELYPGLVLSCACASTLHTAMFFPHGQ